jgi:hypothetical protein
MDISSDYRNPQITQMIQMLFMEFLLPIFYESGVWYKEDLKAMDGYTIMEHMAKKLHVSLRTLEGDHHGQQLLSSYIVAEDAWTSSIIASHIIKRQKQLCGGHLFTDQMNADVRGKDPRSPCSSI